ncbi:MAG: hypothetical protein ABJA79_07860 [Parafilimonas sp.]
MQVKKLIKAVKRKVNLKKIKAMAAPSAIDKQINNYLPQLTARQKKAVLTVVKTFAEEQDETNQYSGDFKKGLDSRYEEYINGGKLISEEEANKRIKKIIKPNSIIAALKEHESIKTSIVKK